MIVDAYTVVAWVVAPFAATYALVVSRYCDQLLKKNNELRKRIIELEGILRAPFTR